MDEEVPLNHQHPYKQPDEHHGRNDRSLPRQIPSEKHHCWTRWTSHAQLEPSDAVLRLQVAEKLDAAHLSL